VLFFWGGGEAAWCWGHLEYGQRWALIGGEGVTGELREKRWGMGCSSTRLHPCMCADGATQQQCGAAGQQVSVVSRCLTTSRERAACRGGQQRVEVRHHVATTRRQQPARPSTQGLHKPAHPLHTATAPPPAPSQPAAAIFYMEHCAGVGVGKGRGSGRRSGRRVPVGEEGEVRQGSMAHK
jgi:hypothetical protein